MSDQFIRHGTELAGVVIQPLVKNVDSRGFFMEAFQKHWNSPIDPVQWSVVKSEPDVLRGPHLHLEHDEYIMVMSGEAYIGLRDVRPGSQTEGQSCLIRLNDENPAAIIFPRGIIHGWCFTKQTLHLQSVSESYKDYHPHDNHGCRWDDPELDLPWPVQYPSLAERANQFPPLGRMLEKLFA